ncbi:Pyridoxal phosphate phosphatase YigL [Escherichia coli]|nr:Pyridoxal phosphate phosphatase YigL [Escherichia coli]
MYQVVASDLDGTLLSPDHTLSPYAKETLKLLTARGINFVFATGRHHVDVGQIRDNLEIKSHDYLQCARVHDLDGNLILLITGSRHCQRSVWRSQRQSGHHY